MIQAERDDDGNLKLTAPAELDALLNGDLQTDVEAVAQALGPEYRAIRAGHDLQWVIARADDFGVSRGLRPSEAWSATSRAFDALWTSGTVCLTRVTLAFAFERVDMARTCDTLRRISARMRNGAASGRVGRLAEKIWSSIVHDRTGRVNLHEHLLDASACAFIPASDHERAYARSLHHIAMAITRDDPQQLDAATHAIDAADRLDQRPGPHAFVIRDEEDGSAEVFFSRDAEHARRRAATAYGEPEASTSDVGHAVAQPAFDAYAPGPVPLQAWFEAGYEVCCSHMRCEHPIDRDGCEACGGDPIVVGEWAYCGTICRDKDRAIVQRDREEAIAAETTARVLFHRLHPKAELISVSSVACRFGDRGRMGRVVFRFPGLRFGDAVFLETAEVDVAGGDVAAFHAYMGWPDNPDRPRHCLHNRDLWVCDQNCEHCGHPCARHSIVDGSWICHGSANCACNDRSGRHDVIL